MLTPNLKTFKNRHIEQIKYRLRLLTHATRKAKKKNCKNNIHPLNSWPLSVGRREHICLITYLYLSPPPTKQDLTQGIFTMKRGWARAEAWALRDVCWSLAHLVQCEPDEPTAELWLTRYITWAWHVYLLIAWTGLESLVLRNACQWRHRPPADGPPETGSHSTLNLSLTLRSGRGTDKPGRSFLTYRLRLRFFKKRRLL